MRTPGRGNGFARLWSCLCLALCLVLGLGVGSAEAKRLALVIGNETYAFALRLDNPVNDATVIAKRLRDLNFEVTEKQNLGGDSMRGVISAFKGQISQGDTVIIYYAGHGMEVEGRDYMLPVNAELHSQSDVKVWGYPLDGLYPDVPNVTLIVLFDACRDSAFAQRINANMAGTTTGFYVPPGSAVMFSTTNGKLAQDSVPTADGSVSRNGLFADTMANVFFTARDLIELLQETQAQVQTRSQGQQVPQFIGIPRNLQFVRGDAPRTPQRPPPPTDYAALHQPPPTDYSGGSTGSRNFGPATDGAPQKAPAATGSADIPTNPFCQNAPSGEVAAGDRACPTSGPAALRPDAVRSDAGYAPQAPARQQPQARVIDAPPPETTRIASDTPRTAAPFPIQPSQASAFAAQPPQRPAEFAAPERQPPRETPQTSQVFSPDAAKPALAAPNPTIQAAILSQDAPEQRLMNIPRAAHPTLGAFTIADLGANILPRRPELRPVPAIHIPASFCTQVDLNEFHDKVYKPANVMAFDNNTDAGQYIAHLDRLRREYRDSTDSAFTVIVVLEAEAYKLIADRQKAISDAYFNMHNAIVATPVRKCH